MRKQITLLLLVLLSSSAMAQAPQDLKPLAARTFTRSFNNGNVSLEYTLRAGPLMEPGTRRFIEIDIDTLMREGAAGRGEFAVPLNGYIAIALPRGIEPDGELRMKFYNGSTGRYDFMYSANYPPAVVDNGLQQAVDDATSRDASRILSGMRELSTKLDGSISFSGPSDARLTGSNPDYAITGTSWLLPCNSLFQQLVDPFDPADSIDYNPRLKATLPVRISSEIANPNIVVYVGSLSTAVMEGSVMSDAVPATARLLEQPPVPAATDPAVESAETADEEPAIEDGESSGEADTAEVAAPVSLRALLYSYGWAAWESEIDLSPVIAAEALAAGYEGSQPEMLDAPVNLDPPAGSIPSGPISISAADPTERINLEAESEETGQPEDDDVGAADDSAVDESAVDETAQDDSFVDTTEDSSPAMEEDDPVEATEPDEEIPAEVEDDSITETENAATDVPEDVNDDELTTDASEEEEAVPGSLAELKEAVEDRKERESGSSVNIELPATARETTQDNTPLEEAIETVQEIQDSELKQDQPATDDQQPAEDGQLPSDDSAVDDHSTDDAAPVRDDIPDFAFPEELAEEAQVAEEGIEAGAGSSNDAAASETTGNAAVREVEPGTLPGAEDLHSVPLKEITGRDGRQPQNQGSTAPDYTQLYIGGGPGGTSAGSTTPADLGDMVFVPGGKFMMGTDELASAGDEDERPLHEVEVADFYIDKYPVTNRQYYQFVLSDGYKPQGNWQKYFEPGTADMPVRGVTWEDANAYCRWAGKRLPTEAEWEKAARGEDGRLYPWGNDWSSDILPRGSLNYRLVLNQQAASPYGVLAMVGVLWQWTSSAWAPYPYDPAASGDVKVLRGGAFSNGRNIIRCANRYPEDASVSFNTFTFRCVKDAN